MGQFRNNHIRIALVGHSALVKELLAHNINEQEDMSVVREMGEVDAASVATLDAEMVIVDPASMDGSVLHAIALVKLLKPRVKVVALSAQNDPDSFLSTVQAGVDAYIIKDRPLDQLMQSLRAVQSGFCIFDCALFTSAVKRMFGKSSTDCNADISQRLDVAGLSARERDVAHLLAKGLSNKDIATALGISISTTKTHVSRVFERLGVSSRREMLPKLYRLSDSPGFGDD